MEAMRFMVISSYIIFEGIRVSSLRVKLRSRSRSLERS